ncbi:MAG: hypothetical protein NWP69_03095, partial [Congregibacter sp.]|nr:hypothetical protein [Congregibacter sp.]
MNTATSNRTLLRVCVAVMGLAFFAAPGSADNHTPSPFQTLSGWAKLPAGRSWGATSAVYPANNGQHIWVGERCGANTCVNSDLDPILLFDENGELLRSFGAGLISWPHGMFVDARDNVWVADAVGYAPVPEGVGHVVRKFSPQGELLLTLGRPGAAGDGEQTFRKPSDVLVAPNGNIFVADGHGSSPYQPVNNRIVKFDAQGRFINAWGQTGDGVGEFVDPHALAMDSQGRLFVGDRGN